MLRGRLLERLLASLPRGAIGSDCEVTEGYGLLDDAGRSKA